MSKTLCHDENSNTVKGTCTICGEMINPLNQKREIMREKTVTAQTENKTSVLEATNKNQEGTVLFLQENTSIGRGGDNTIMIDDASVSKKHCSIIKKNEHWVIEDKKSMNGVYVNNKQIESQKLENNDCIQIGAYTFHYKEQ